MLATSQDMLLLPTVRSTLRPRLLHRRLSHMQRERLSAKVTTGSVLAAIRPDRQLCLFSATFPKSVEQLARESLKYPVEVMVGGRSVASDGTVSMGAASDAATAARAAKRVASRIVGRRETRASDWGRSGS